MGKSKLTYETIKEAFDNRGCNLLSTVYVNCRTKLDYECSKGHIHSISWDSFKQGHGCPVCAGQGKPKIEDIRKEFEKEGYVLISNEYVNDKHKLEYRCNLGHYSSMRWQNWKIGRRCPTCKAIKSSVCKTGSKHYNWNGGITRFNKELRNFISSIGWSSYVLKRDNYVCQICGKKGGNLVAHHIVSLSEIKERYQIESMTEVFGCNLLFNTNNGLTVCDRCHKEFHFGGNKKDDFGRRSKMVYNEPFTTVMLCRNLSNSGELLTSNVEDNPERSLEKERATVSRKT